MSVFVHLLSTEVNYVLVSLFSDAVFYGIAKQQHQDINYWRGSIINILGTSINEPLQYVSGKAGHFIGSSWVITFYRITH